MRSWELLEHTADIKLKARASDLPGLFLACLEGMLKGAGYKTKGRRVFKKEFSLRSFSTEGLLVSFLEEVLFLAETEKIVYYQADFLEFHEKELTCIMKGKELERMGVHIKAVTWHDLKIQKRHNLWEVIITFDI